MSLDLTRTAAALEAYDQNPSEQLAREVGVAYGLDTADRNDPATCADFIRPGPAVPKPGYEPSFVREMVRKWKAGEFTPA